MKRITLKNRRTTVKKLNKEMYILTNKWEYVLKKAVLLTFAMLLPALCIACSYDASELNLKNLIIGFLLGFIGSVGMVESDIAGLELNEYDIRRASYMMDKLEYWAKSSVTNGEFLRRMHWSDEIEDRRIDKHKNAKRIVVELNTRVDDWKVYYVD